MIIIKCESYSYPEYQKKWRKENREKYLQYQIEKSRERIELKKKKKEEEIIIQYLKNLL